MTRRIEAAGLTGIQDMLAFLMDPHYVEPRVVSMLKKRYLGGVKVRAIDKKNLDAELEVMRDIFNDVLGQQLELRAFHQGRVR